MAHSRRSWPWWRWALTGFSALALVLCAYLSWHYLVGASVIGCSDESACERVLSSRWSTVGGILPVSGLGAGLYQAILLAGLFIGPGTPAPARRLAWGVMLVLAGAAAGSAVWFTIVQIWVIGAFCPYCMATHIIGLILAALVVGKAPRQFDGVSTDLVQTNAAPVQDGSSRRSILRLFAIGLALAGIVAVCQVAIAPPAVYRGGQSQTDQPLIDPRAVPLVGSPNAPYVVNLLFDYKCPHCQRMHFLVDEVIRRYNGKLAFALCPAPLNRQCNPYVLRDADQFKDSCELAKVGLAVWLADRQAFAVFNHWMFSLESGDFWHPRSMDAAKAKAVELVGQAKFDAALADPWIERFLQASTGIYGDTIDRDHGGNALPKLVFGSRWVTPEVRDVDDFISILHDALALPEP